MVALVAEEDRYRWDERYIKLGAPPLDAVQPPGFLRPHISSVPTTGRALDLACGHGLGALWLAQRGLKVMGLDVSPVVVDQARALALRSGVAGQCRFVVRDLDDGLPPGPPVDVILCNKFRDHRLDRSLIGRLAPGGLLAMATLSEVDAEPGPFRAKPGELLAAFAELDLIAAGEGQGSAWLLARAPIDHRTAAASSVEHSGPIC